LLRVLPEMSGMLSAASEAAPRESYCAACPTGILPRRDPAITLNSEPHLSSP
jgi:hypothetical protein